MTKLSFRKWSIALKSIFTLVVFLFVFSFLGAGRVFAAPPPKDTTKGDSNQQLLNQYIQAKGTGNIVFDTSNIKQFWIDKSVSAKNDSIVIGLNATKKESVPLKIQLANVNETQDCRIDVIAETKDMSFSVLDNKQHILSSSEKNDDFINYSVFSSIIHLEDTNGLSFFLKFESTTHSSISIKKIVFSFTKNENSTFLVSPGKISFSMNNVSIRDNGSRKIDTKKTSETSFSVTGIQSIVSSTNNILISDTPISSFVKIKNIGKTQTRVTIGFGCYSKDKEWINGRNYPYKANNSIVNVVSFSEEQNTIVVDHFSDWAKNCFLALNAKEDMSDIPSFSLAEGSIIDVKKIDDDKVELVMSKPLNSKIEKGMKVRIHGQSGAFLYPATTVLNPGEEITLSSTIGKDELFLQYSPKAFSKGVYYITPMILSYSLDASAENTVLISDYTLSY